MTVRAKFLCTSNEAGPDTHTIIMRAVTSSDCEENDRFFRYTPSGELRIAVVAPTTAAKFVVGQAYYLDFTPADESA